MKLYGLIGYPLEHSFSKKYFTEKFSRENIPNASFELFPLRSIKDLPAVLSLKDLTGLAVTIPYKGQVLPFINLLHDDAKSIGAVNCIKISKGKLKGYNTDLVGFEKSFTPMLMPHHRGALVLGGGGGSKAVQFILLKLKIPFLVVTRSHDLRPGEISYKSIDAALLDEYPVIINCTPVGMSPHINEKLPLPFHLFSSYNYLYDLIYNPVETAFLKEGKKYGSLIKNGNEMFLIQAEENWRIWNEE
jgi:shikimate dehydrogenase